MDPKGFMRLFVLLLGFTYLIAYVSAVPVTRSLKSAEEKPSSVQSFFPQEKTYISDNDNEMVGYIELARRMGLEYNDYPGAGANNNHDPRTPGRA